MSFLINLIMFLRELMRLLAEYKVNDYLHPLENESQIKLQWKE